MEVFLVSNRRAETRHMMRRSETKRQALSLGLAVVPEVDQGIGERFEGVMHLAEALEAKQQSAELVFPREHPLNCAEPLVENSLLEEGLAASFGFFSGTRIWVDIGVVSPNRRKFRSNLFNV
jgi:hypothetical protein